VVPKQQRVAADPLAPLRMERRPSPSPVRPLPY